MPGEFNYIQKSLELFPKLTKIMFGWEYDMSKIETKVSHVKQDDCLDRDDLLLIRDAKEWDYKKFWPDLMTAIDLGKPIIGIFNLGPEAKRTTISSMYKRFLHIEVVSLLLRFIDPQKYAIISPPVEKFFSLQPKGNHVEYYLHYLDLLGKTSKHFREPSKISDVDMAIWGLTFLIKGWGDEDFRARWAESDRAIIELIIHRYKTDRFFKKIRLREVLQQAYQEIGQDAYEPNRVFLADCLDSEEIDPELAMITISFCFERFLWQLIEETGRVDDFIRLRHRKEWIDKLKGIKIFQTSFIFDQCAKFRDRAVHPWLKKLEAAEREEFISHLETLMLKKKAGHL